MKYFFDTEFTEGFHKPLFGKRRHFIDLISIGIVAEDGRTYYAISNEWRYKDADNWVKENVIHKLPLKLKEKETFSEMNQRCKIGINDFDKYQWLKGKSNKQIAKEIAHFCNPDLFLHNTAEPDLEFYAYYADYDWVLLCSLFGRMIDLPKGFPMYCKDLKQMIDDAAAGFTQLDMTTKLYEQGNWKVATELPKNVIDLESWTLGQKIEMLKIQPGYPKQENEHSAIDDAKWNKKLYEFLINL